MSVEPDREMHRHESVLIRPSFPLRKGKVQRPLLPEDTLRRDRLLDWMTSKAHCRLIYIVAEAGFGKTTLAADFTRRSRVRTFWYRLDEDDTDGLVMIRYIVASARNVDPELFRATDSLLTEPSLEPVSFDSVFPTFMYEFERLGDVPSVIVLDDYYMAEHVASIRSTLEKLIERAPANLTFIFATRRTPDLSVASFRARGDLAELGREDLRLVLDETRRLFEVHNQPLEPDVLESVQARTDGWAASLQLVKTAVEGRTRSQIRAFVDSLSGAEGHLYDYLAEEVVGDLAPDLRGFLLRVSLLEDIDTETAASVTTLGEPTVRRLIAEAQRIGLLSRAEGSPGWRPHPLVREFLLAHLEVEVGHEGVLQLHRDIARVFEPISWRLSARHWALAGEPASVRRVLTAAVPSIIASGDLEAAEELRHAYPDEGNPWFSLLGIRCLISSGRATSAREELARLKISAPVDTGELRRAVALAELGACFELGDGPGVERAAKELLDCGDAEFAAIGRASFALFEASDRGNLVLLIEAIREAIDQSHQAGHLRFEGIGLLNLAAAHRLAAQPREAAAAARDAVERLTRARMPSELAAARSNAATALADLGDMAGASREAELILLSEGPIPRDAFIDLAILHAQYDGPHKAAAFMEARLTTRWEPEADRLRALADAWLLTAKGQFQDAKEALAGSPAGTVNTIAITSSMMALQMQLEAILGLDPRQLLPLLESEIEEAARQNAWFNWYTLRLVLACSTSPDRLSAYCHELGRDHRNHLSVAAALVGQRLHWLDSEALRLTREEVELRPERWRPILRVLVDDKRTDLDLRRLAATLLVHIGTEADLPRLAAVSRDRALGVSNASRLIRRRLAKHAYVEDLGRVRLRIGDQVVVGSEVRRKVLSLLAFLLTRPQFAATKEQIQEAIWPELDPPSAANSLNQSVYFLRRVFEPTCKENDSAGYVDSRGDLIWLDRELVTSRSSECLELLGSLRRTADPETIAQLAAKYVSRFATDFLYDDWSCAFRDSLHAAFLAQVEREIRDDLRLGALERGIALAQQALMADPEAEDIELLLLRLYLAAGAHGAAAEQYAHYASVMREQLGVEPPSLENLLSG